PSGYSATRKRPSRRAVRATERHPLETRSGNDMPINPDAVGATGEPVEGSWDSKDCLLYALGVGAGQSDPTGIELEFTTENSQDISQKVLPTFAVIAGMAG